MSSIAQSLENIRTRVTVLERRYERTPGDVRVLAVSKTKPPEAVLAAADAGRLIPHEVVRQWLVDLAEGKDTPPPTDDPAASGT